MPFFENFCEIGINFTNYLPTKYKNTVYHYTSINNWSNILLQEDCANEITLYASQIDCLNDYMENQLASSLYYETIEELCDNGTLTLEAKKMLEKVKPSSFVPMKSKNIESYQDCNIYVSCFSKKDDLLNMWKYYSKGSIYEAISIGVNDGFEDSISGIKEPFKAMVLPVVYSKATQKKYIEHFTRDFAKKCGRFIEESDQDVVDTFFGDALLLWNTLFKAEGFKEEQEVRVIVFMPKANTSEAVRYRTSNQYIIPYIKLKINKEYVSEIRFGPMDEQRVTKNCLTLKDALSGKFPSIIVSKSSMPLRY